MIKSMTAFSRAEISKANISSTIEIKSYNSRFLDVIIRIPQAYYGFEEKIKSVVSKKLTRGRVEIYIHITDESQEFLVYEIDEVRANSYYNVLVDLKRKFNIDDTISLSLMTGVSGIIKVAEIEKDLDMHWSVINECLEKALDDLNDMRTKEGQFIASDFGKRLDYIEKNIDLIEQNSSDIVQTYKQRLIERIETLIQNSFDMDMGRIEQEAAILADKSDISEEIVRSRSHIAQFRNIMNSNEPGGRKLNFLLQEFNREFNTIGSKTSKTQVSHIVVDIKSELEKLREQVQNIE